MMNEKAVEQAAAPPLDRYRLALWFAIGGDWRYLSQLDSMELFRRALIRSGIAVRYSQGFNPHVRITLPAPRSVGMAAQRELLLAEMDRPEPADEVLARLGAQLPAGIVLHEAYYVAPNVSAQPVGADYAVTLAPQADGSALREHLERQPQITKELTIVRPANGRHRPRHLRLSEYLSELQLADRRLTFHVRIDPQATPRVTEILNALGLRDPLGVEEIIRLVSYYADGLYQRIALPHKEH